MKVRASGDPTQSQGQALDPGILDRTVDLTRSQDLKIINLRDDHGLEADEVQIEPLDTNEHGAVRSSFSYQNQITSPQTALR